MNSKWSYMVSGFNIAFAFVGAMFHSALLLIISIIFAIWNYYIAEGRREVENEQIREEDTETKE